MYDVGPPSPSHPPEPPPFDYEGFASGIYADLAQVRGAVRSRRSRLRLLPPGSSPSDPDVREVFDLLGPAVRRGPNAPWDAFAAGTTEPGALVRIGSVRVVDGPDSLAEVPVSVPLLGLGHLVLRDRAREPDAARPEIEALVGSLSLRILVGHGPGSVTVTIARSVVPGFLDEPSLRSAGIVEVIDADRSDHLDHLLASVNKAMSEPTSRAGATHRVIVLDQVGRIASGHQMEELQRLLRHGPRAGIHAILIDVELSPDVPAEYIAIGPDGRVTTTLTGGMDVRLDSPPPPHSPAMQAMRQLTAYATAELEKPMPARPLLPARIWTESPSKGLRCPIGYLDGDPHNVALDDQTPHALVGGPSGSGKTNLLYGLIAGLVARYGPHDLALYLLDFKEGQSISRFAPDAADPTWLPQARLVGVNINADREFGLALLRYLADELSRRGAAARNHGAVDLAGIRERDPGGHWPRMVAIIDEFQFLVGDRDAITDESVALLEDLARRGRSQGIHLVLCSQDLSGVEALWGRQSLVAQLTLRIAMPRARRVLTEDNPLADTIPRFHAVVNADSGHRAGNRVVRLPDFGGRELTELQAHLCRQAGKDAPRPVVFDADRVPQLTESAPYRGLTVDPAGSPSALVGRRIHVEDLAADMSLSRAPGRNLAVIGNAVSEACDILATAALSLSRRVRPGTVRFSVLSCDPDGHEPARRLQASLARGGHEADLVKAADLAARLETVATRVRQGLDGGLDHPHFLIAYSLDSATSLLQGESATDDLITVMQSGPEVDVHMLGWWRTAARMKEQLGGYATRLDEIGAWVGLDVRGADLSALPGAELLSWQPRPRRALFFDRTVHRQPEVVIPYDTGGAL